MNIATESGQLMLSNFLASRRHLVPTCLCYNMLATCAYLHTNARSLKYVRFSQLVLYSATFRVWKALELTVT